MPTATNLVLVTQPHLAERAVAAWERVLPEDDLPHIQSTHAEWRGDVLYAFHSDRPDYIEALENIIEEEIPASEPHLVRVF